MQRKSNSRDSFFLTHDSQGRDPSSVSNINANTRKPVSAAFFSAPGDQDPPESAESFGPFSEARRETEKENQQQPAEYGEERQQQKQRPSRARTTKVSQDAAGKQAMFSREHGSDGHRTPAEPGPGLLIDCSKTAIKKPIGTPSEVLQLLPANVVPDSIKVCFTHAEQPYRE